MALTRTAAWLVAMVLSAGAWAHGDTAHRQAGAVSQEQTDWGTAGDAKAATRTIQVGMDDAMRFTPATITVRLGETLRFVVRNNGRQLHEFVLGTKQALDAHAALMLKFPTMEHDEPYMAHVPAGKSAEILWTFNRPGRFEFACLIAGHHQAGMVGTITVRAK